MATMSSAYKAAASSYRRSETSRSYPASARLAAVLRSRVTGIDRGAAQLVEAGEGGGEVILVEELLSFDPQIGVEDRDEVELPLVAGAVGAAPDALGAHQRRAATEVHGPVEEPLP